jgi:hypothetical protein
MPKFLAGFHYNEEEINRHLEEKERKKKNIGQSKLMATSLHPVKSSKDL